MSKTLDELNRLYTDADEIGKEHCAKMRTNLLLISGDHYDKLNRKATTQLRTSKGSTPSTDQKLRLVQNHQHKIKRVYKQAILDEAPGVGVSPKNPKERQDVKDAELNQAVWVDVKQRHHIEDRTDDWADQFVGIGEVCTKIFWDPMAGEFTGYAPKLDDAGQPIMNPDPSGALEQVIDPVTGQIVIQPKMIPEDDEDKPQFKGDFALDDIYGFNLLREEGTVDMRDKHRAWIVRKMVDVKELQAQYADDKEISAKIQETSNQTYIVFDSLKGTYEKKKGQCCVREFYWEPCSTYPEGWFEIATENVKLAEGPLPFGIFPLVWECFDKNQSAPRGHSIIEVSRPWQAEINRSSSAMAIAQVTLGDDKVLYQAGTKLSQGALLPGVRGVAYQGAMPTVLPGRTGSQYLEYNQYKTSEMYGAVMIDENEVVDKSAQVEPWIMLYAAAKRKKKYSPYSARFERFLVKVCEVVLDLAKHYLPDDALIAAVGRREQINIPEFRKTSKLSQQIKVEPRGEAIESQLGKQLTFMQLIQYAGKQLDPKMLGKLAKNLPFGNWENTFDDLTIDEDIFENDCLAIERDEEVTVTQYIDPDYMVKKLTKRIKEPDFRFLPDTQKQAFSSLKTEYEQLVVEAMEKKKAMQNEYIPVDGALVTCDFYIPDPKDPTNQSKRAKIPQRSIEWLMKQLEAQGADQEKLEGMNVTALSEMADMMLKNKANKAAAQQAPGQNPRAPMPQMAG